MDTDDTVLATETADLRVPPVLYPWQEQAWARVVQQVAQQHLPHALSKSAWGRCCCATCCTTLAQACSCQGYRTGGTRRSAVSVANTVSSVSIIYKTDFITSR